MLLVVSLIGVASVSSGLAQTAPSPAKACADAEFRQFDFWVGNWEASWPGSKPNEVQHGRNSIRRVLGDCVIEEQFDGADAISLRGMSVSTYVPAAKKWKQTWVDNQGGYLDFIGEFSGGQMVLSRHALGPQGQEIEQRMVYKNITANGFAWSWEQSTDGGKTWKVLWPIQYTREKQ